MTLRKRMIVLAGCLALIAFFASPSLILGYSLIGGSLGLSTGGNGYQRDFRVFNNFLDASANNNTIPDPLYPGALGANLAIWKAATEWASTGPRSAKNFDFDYQGDANAVGGIDENICSGITSGCSGSTLAFVQTPIANGWRMRFCEQWTWSDGPGGAPGGQIDLQGVATHEFGHSLGMGHAQSNFCSGSCGGRSTMCPSICTNGTGQRTLAVDDANGLQAIYGPIPGNKPMITSVTGSFDPGGVLTIHGSNFASSVNVKFTAGTTQNTGTIPGVVYGAPSTNGGTQVTVVVPAAARPGNVLVWQPTTLLSNAFPFGEAGGVSMLPVINDIMPNTVQAFRGGTVSVIGDFFTGATTVLLNGGSIPFTFVNDELLQFEAPDAQMLGSQAVEVTTGEGTSTPRLFFFLQTNPARLVAPAQTTVGASFRFDFGIPIGGEGTPTLMVALNPATSNQGGFDVLALPRRSFTNFNLDETVGIGNTTKTIPGGAAGRTFYSQMVVVGAGGAVLTASEVVQTTVD